MKFHVMTGRKSLQSFATLAEAQKVIQYMRLVLYPCEIRYQSLHIAELQRYNGKLVVVRAYYDRPAKRSPKSYLK